MTEISKLTPEERDALAGKALEAQKKAKKRAQSYREKKTAAGLKPLTLWVPAERVDFYRNGLQEQINKHEAKLASQSKTSPVCGS